MNIERRTSNIEHRIMNFVILKKSSEATSTIRQSSIVIRHSMKFHMSTGFGCQESGLRNPEIRTLEPSVTNNKLSDKAR